MQEALMLSTRVRELMDARKLLLAEPQSNVREAAAAMEEHGTGAVLVVDAGKIVGIFTERDIVFRVVARGLDAATTPLAHVMTPEPKTIAPDKSFGQAMLLMHANGFRHLPVVDNGTPVGIVSARSALDPDLEEFVAEERRRKSLQEAR
jgi:CBS domain-containing protein